MIVLRRTLLLLLPALLHVPGPGGARGRLVALDGALRGATTVAAVNALAPERRDDDLAGLLVALRRGELAQDWAGLVLVLDKTHWLRGDADGAWLAYVQARAFATLARMDRLPAPTAARVGLEDNAEAAWRTLLLALDRDSLLPPARRLLGELVEAGNERMLRADQAAAVMREAGFADAAPGALVAWARALRNDGQPEAALRTARRAVLRGADPMALALELARHQVAAGYAAAGEAMYWRGLDWPTAPGRAAYRADLAWIIDADSLARFDEVPDADVAAWLRRFWGERDATAGRDAGERVREHLRRYVTAFRHFRVIAPWRRDMYSAVDMEHDRSLARGVRTAQTCHTTDYDLFRHLREYPPELPGDLRVREPVLDHRGLLYIRHGAAMRLLRDGRPTTDLPPPPSAEIIARLDAPFWFGVPDLGHPLAGWGRPTETWALFIEGGSRTLHFKGSGAYGQHAATTLTTLVATPDGDFGCSQAKTRLNEAAAEDLRVAVAADTDNPPLETVWPSRVLGFAIGHERERNGTALMTVAYRTDALRADTLEDRLRYAVALRFIAYELRTGARHDVDTTVVLERPRGASAPTWLAAHLPFALPAGRWQVTVRAGQDDPGAGALSVARNLVIDSLPGLTLSDLVTGREGAPSWTATDGAPFPLSASDAWPAGGRIELFYEVRGLPAATRYTSAMEVLTASGERRIRLETPGIAADGVTRVRGSLGLGSLPPGRYLLRVTVTSPAGARAVRERPLTVTSP